MGASIRGVRIDSLSFERTSDGKETLSGKYALMSNTDKVLATQSINNYSDIKVDFSAKTKKILAQLVASVKEETEIVLGIIEDEKGVST